MADWETLKQFGDLEVRGGVIRVALVRPPGTDDAFLDVRKWWDDGGEMRPTGKGVMVRRERAGELVGILGDAIEGEDG